MTPKELERADSLLDRVTEVGLLHSGGESDVYKIVANGKDYVLKWYKAGIAFDKNALDVVQKSRASGLYKIVEFGKREKSSYLVYEFIDGVSSDRLSAIAVPVALHALRQVCSSLSKVRRDGASHGDLNPANVIVSYRGKEFAWKLKTWLIDFGIVGPGALTYAAPERFQGGLPSEKSDLFSLGLLLYRWVTGEDLVDAHGYEEIASGISSIDCTKISEKLYLKFQLDPEYISALEPLWKGLLSKDVDLRLEDFEELDELLEIALDQVSGGEVALNSVVQNFLEGEKLLKAGTKVSLIDKCDLPYTISKDLLQKRTSKIFVFLIHLLILAVVALFIYLGTRGPDIDATGEMLLMQSRNLDAETSDSAYETVPSDSTQIQEILQDLPTPVSK